MSKQQEDEINALRARLADVQTRLRHIAIADHPAEAALDYLQELQKVTQEKTMKNQTQTLYKGVTPQAYDVTCTTDGKTLKVTVNGRHLIAFEFHPGGEEDAKAFARLLCVSRMTVQK